ncbi:MAG: PucR family transcriptional regulator ligand-binding domain-containing protein [Eggerthella lenta]
MRDGTEGLLVTVADIIALPAFKNVELVAPCEGAERREVRNVGILDCPPDYNEYSVYVAGELILTNLGFAFGNPGMAEKSLLTMLRRDVAAIAVKTVYEPPISDAVRKESTARGVPLYLYDGAYHETVAYQSLDLLQRDRD